jgi:hypothetical protein
MRDKHAHTEMEDEDLARTDELPVLAEDAVVIVPGDLPGDHDAADTADTADTGPHPTIRIRALEPVPAAVRRQESSVQTLEETVKAVLHEVDESRASQARLEAAVELRDSELADLRAQVAQQLEEINALTAEAAADDAAPDEVETLTAYIESSRERWDEMERQLNAQAERSAEMERELEQRVAREQALEQQAHEAQAQVKELRQKLAETLVGRKHADTELERLQKLLTEKEHALDRQNERLTTLQHDLSERVAALARAQIAAVPTAAAELRPAGRGAVNGAAPLPVLICLTGTKPKRHVVNATETLIGRGPDCAIRIFTHFVSREHAKLKNENGKVIIHDCGSKNGVFVNSIRVDRHELQHGDWITIGETQFRFLLEGAQA